MSEKLEVERNEIVATYKHLRRSAAGHAENPLTPDGEDFACESCAKLERALIAQIDRLVATARAGLEDRASKLNALSGDVATAVRKTLENVPATHGREVVINMAVDAALRVFQEEIERSAPRSGRGDAQKASEK